MTASLNFSAESSLFVDVYKSMPANPSSHWEGFAESSRGLCRRADYIDAAFFFIGCFSASGLRACGFTAVSSTGVVPVTSLENVAPEGTR